MESDEAQWDISLGKGISKILHQNISQVLSNKRVGPYNCVEGRFSQKLIIVYLGKSSVGSKNSEIKKCVGVVGENIFKKLIRFAARL